jgi:hypothetical protein
VSRVDQSHLVPAFVEAEPDRWVSNPAAAKNTPKGTAQIAREVIAEAVAVTNAARTASSSIQKEVESGVAHLEEGFKLIDPSIVLDVQVDDAFVLANERASLYVPIAFVGRAWRINRSGFGKIEIVVPTKGDDAVERLVAALGSVVEDFEAWSHGAARRNGRLPT